MSIFGKVFKTAFDLATLPIDVAKDVVTLGGVATDKDRPYTMDKLTTLDKDVRDVSKELGDL